MKNMETLKYEADYILNSKEKSLDTIARDLKISTRTLQLHINKDLKEKDYDLYLKVRDHINCMIEKKLKEGGSKGVRTTSYDINYINNIADMMIDAYDTYMKTGLKKDFTIRDISEKFNIPKSTLFDLFIKYLDEERLKKIKSIFLFNKTLGKSNFTLSDIELDNNKR